MKDFVLIKYDMSIRVYVTIPLIKLSSLKHGSFDHLDQSNISTPSEEGSSIGASVACSATVPAHSVQTITFSLSWASPDVRFPAGRIYKRSVNYFLSLRYWKQDRRII